VLQDELPAALEEVEQLHLALRALEDVGLVDPHHRQAAAVGVESVPCRGQLLLAGQQSLASGEPLVARRDLWQAHVDLLRAGVRSTPGKRQARRPKLIAATAARSG